jgi:hypothetical protein
VNTPGASTCARCHAILAPHSPLSDASRLDVASEPSDRTASRSASAPTQRRRALIITLILAVLLGLTGYGAVRAAELLQHAMRPPANPTEVANTACKAYTTQDYALLTQEIDPAPVPPANNDPFNPAIVQTQLRALDKISGVVVRCTPGTFTSSPAGGQYPLTLHREKASGNVGVVLVLHLQRDGSWKISRETNFAGTSTS